jgi:hypothetical protein
MSLWQIWWSYPQKGGPIAARSFGWIGAMVLSHCHLKKKSKNCLAWWNDMCVISSP